MAFQTTRFGSGAILFSGTVAFPHEGQEWPLVSIKTEQSWRMFKAGLLLQFIFSHRPDSFRVESIPCNTQKMKHLENKSYSYKYNAEMLYLAYRLNTINWKIRCLN